LRSAGFPGFEYRAGTLMTAVIFGEQTGAILELNAS